MPIRKSERRGAALRWHRALFLSHLTASRAPRHSGESTSRIASGFFSGASLQFVLQGFDQDNVPDYCQKQDFGMFFAVNMASGGLAAAGSLTIRFPLDYARTRLASVMARERNLHRFVRSS